MHAIRRAARQQAWSVEPQDPRPQRIQLRRDDVLQEETIETSSPRTSTFVEEVSKVSAPGVTIEPTSAPEIDQDGNIELRAVIRSARQRRTKIGSAIEFLRPSRILVKDGKSMLALGDPGTMLRALFGPGTLFHPRWNVLFVFVPTGFALYYTHQAPPAVFVINFIAMLPSAQFLAFGVEQAILYVGDTFGDLLSTSASNVAQLITSILLLKARQIPILEASLMGAILQSLLLMTGLSFLAGGINYQEQYFGKEVAQTICMLLLLAVLSVLMPTLAKLLGTSTDHDVLLMSRGTAVVIMISYILYMIFQIWTDPEFFEAVRPQRGRLRQHAAIKRGIFNMRKPLRSASVFGAAIGGATALRELQVTELEVKEEEAVLSFPVAVLVVALGTTLLTFNTSFVTDSLQYLVESQKITDTFMGIVVLPLLGNDINAIKTAMNDRMDMSLALSLERCMQTALMVVPLIIIIAWGMGVDEVSMHFNQFSVAALFASIVIVCYVVQEGKCNWLYGALLVKVFVIVGLASFFTN